MYRFKTLLTFGQLQAGNRGSTSLRSLRTLRSPGATVAGCPPNGHHARRAYVAPVAAEPFLSGSSSNYVEEMYQSWLEDPKSVHKSWDIFFRNAQNGAAPGTAYTPPPPVSSMYPATTQPSAMTTSPAGRSLGAPLDRRVIEDHLSVQTIIRSYQIRGHNISNLDPLGINNADLNSEIPAELETKNYKMGFAKDWKCT